MKRFVVGVLRGWRYSSASPVRAALRVLFSGDRYHCVVCDSDLRIFLPLPRLYARETARHGFPYGPDDFETLNASAYACPVCGASDRDRLIATYAELVAIPALPKTAMVVDFAPAQGLSAYFRKHLPATTRYLRADKFAPNVDLAVDLCHMPEISPNSIGFWICSHVLEHVDNDAAAVGELYRILAPGGLGIALAPVLLDGAYTPPTAPALTESDRWHSFGQGDHARLYTRQGFVNLLLSANFILAEVRASDLLGSRADALGIQPRATLYVVRKSVAGER